MKTYNKQAWSEKLPAAKTLVDHLCRLLCICRKETLLKFELSDTDPSSSVVTPHLPPSFLPNLVLSNSQSLASSSLS